MYVLTINTMPQERATELLLSESINRIVDEQLRQGLVLDFADSKKKKKKTKVSKKDKKAKASEEHLIGLGVEMGFEPDTVNTTWASIL